MENKKINDIQVNDFVYLEDILKEDQIVEEVRDKFLIRSEIGKKKYGVTLDRDDLSYEDWLNHLQEELMDSILYIQKLKSIIKK
jgi:hypothetical protein